MKQEAPKVAEVWEAVRTMVDMAYFYQQTAADPSVGDDPHIVQTLRKVVTVLRDHEEKNSKSECSQFDFYGINQLHRVYSDFVEDKIEEREAKIKIWQILASPDDPEYYDEDSASKLCLLTKKQIAECGGPQQAAIDKWTDVRSGSHRTFYYTQKKFNSGDLYLPIALQRLALRIRERDKFRETVCAQILNFGSESESHVISPRRESESPNA